MSRSKKISFKENNTHGKIQRTFSQLVFAIFSIIQNSNKKYFGAFNEFHVIVLSDRYNALEYVLE